MCWDDKVPRWTMRMNVDEQYAAEILFSEGFCYVRFYDRISITHFLSTSKGGPFWSYISLSKLRKTINILQTKRQILALISWKVIIWSSHEGCSDGIFLTSDLSIAIQDKTNWSNRANFKIINADSYLLTHGLEPWNCFIWHFKQFGKTLREGSFILLV